MISLLISFTLANGVHLTRLMPFDPIGFQMQLAVLREHGIQPGKTTSNPITATNPPTTLCPDLTQRMLEAERQFTSLAELLQEIWIDLRTPNRRNRQPKSITHTSRSDDPTTASLNKGINL